MMPILMKTKAYPSELAINYQQLHFPRKLWRFLVQNGK